VRVRAVIRMRFLVAVLAAGVAAAGPTPLTFEAAVRASDRIIVGTVQGAGAGSVRIGESNAIALGIKDAATGLVFTPYRVRVDQCLFDRGDACSSEDMEIFIPGGTVYETVDGEERLRTWEVAGGAGAPLPPIGSSVLLFMSERNGRHLPLNDRGARVPVDKSSGTAAVTLRFASPRFLSDAGQEAAHSRLAAGSHATTAPVFVESVELDRLKSMVELARQVLKPTSGLRHAIPGRVDFDDARFVRQRHSRIRPG